MNTAKVEITFGRYICNIRRDALLLAEFPYPRASFRVVYCRENHGDMGVVQIRWFELSIHMFDLLALHSMRHFSIESISRADYRDLCISIQKVQNTSSSDL